MAEINAIIADTFNDGSRSSILCFDTITDINHSFTNDITTHKVEVGRRMSDHVSQNNAVFTFSGLISAIPFENGSGSLKENNLVNSTSDLTQAAFSRIDSAYRLLTELRDTGDSFTFVSGYDSYDTCVVRELSLERNDTSTVTSLFVRMVVEQIRLSTSEVVLITETQQFNPPDSETGDDLGSENTQGSSSKKEQRSVSDAFNDTVSRIDELNRNLLYNTTGGQ
jgi:hypothetical protein